MKCPRCGKEVLLVKTWQEKVGNSTVTYSKHSCPDGACQKMVDKTIKTEKDKRMAQAKEKERREVERAANAKLYKTA